MKTTLKKLALFVLVATVCIFTLALTTFALTDYLNTTFASNYFYVDTDKDPMTYEVGETMTFSGALKTPAGDLVSVPYFSYSFSGDDGVSASGRVSGKNGTFTLTHSISCPGFVRLTVNALDSDGNVINNNVVLNGGACAEWEKIETAMAEPDDFDEYWERTLRELDAVYPSIYNLKIDTVNTDSKYKVYDLYVNAPGSKRFLNTAPAGEEPNGATYMAGKLTVPVGLEQGSAKFYLGFQGAGVYESPGVSKKANTVTLNVYAHSIELSRESSYYTSLNNGLLSGYMRRALYNDNAEESYTKYMVLRDLQAVRFLKTFFGTEGGNVTEFGGIDISGWKGLWNGKDIEIYGQSQGGFQCIAVAALDHDINLCRPWVPCWCDMYAKTYYPTRRTMSLVYEHYSQKYFDSVALGKRIVCRTNVLTGFGDDTCPTTGVIAAYNAMTCEKSLTIVQSMPHNCSQNYATNVPKQQYTSGVENFEIPYGWEFTFDWEIASVSDPTVLSILSDGRTVSAIKKGSAIVNFVDSDRSPITIDVETAVQDLIISDGSLSAEAFAGMAKSVYTRTVNTVFAADSWADFADDIANGNIVKGITYYVISDLEGNLSYSADQMYALFENSGADYLVMIPGRILTETSAAMYKMALNPEKYPNAYFCDNGSSESDYEAGRNAGNNIVSIIERNKPLLDATYKVYDAITGEEIKSLSILPEGEELSIVIIPAQPYNNIGSFKVSAEGLALDGESFTITGDADGGILLINDEEYKIYADVISSGVEEDYSWVLDSEGKLTVLTDGDVNDTAYPWASYASQILEIEVAVGAKKVASAAFANVTSLKSLTLPYTIEEIASDAVSGASQYTVYGYENNAAVTGFAQASGMEFVSLGACGSAGQGLMWEYKDGTLYITGYGSTVYSGCSGYDKHADSSWYSYYNNIEKLVICDGVTTIDSYCFFKMTKLKSVEIPTSLTKLKTGAFMACSGIKSIYIRGNEPVSGTIDLSCVTEMSGGYQFDGGATSADTFILSDNLTGSLGDKFLTLNSAMKSLTIPAGVTGLAGRSISGCSALKELTVLGYSTSINAGALDYSETKSTVLEVVYGKAGSSAAAFAESKGIEFRDLTGDVYDGPVELSGECGESVFFKIVANGSADTYSIYFYGIGTEIVTVCDENGCSLAPWAPYADSITRAVFRGNITSIGAYTLSGLSALEEIEFDGCNITSLCANAFSGSGISGIFEIPEEIASIEANAFAGLADSITPVVLNGNTSIASGAFAGTVVDKIYSYHKSDVEAYANSNSIAFANINEYLPVATGKLYATYNNAVTVNTTWYYDKATFTLSFVSNQGGWNETGSLQYCTDGIGWSIFADEIQKIVVGSDLDKVSGSAFKNLKALTTVELPTTVGQIDNNAFNGCSKLDTIYINGFPQIKGLADLHAISNINSQANAYAGCAFNTVIIRSDKDSVNDSAFANTPISKVIGTSQYTADIAQKLGAAAVTGYSSAYTVWTYEDGVLTVYANGTPAYYSSWTDYADSITKIVFEKESDITALNTGVFDGFASLEEVLFRCDAPDSAAASCFGTNNVNVYYAEGITSFTSPNWNGYTCLEEGSTIGIIASGVCKDGGYVWAIDDLGTLTISGTGDGTLSFAATPNYDKLTVIPWYSHRSSIKKVVIEESTGITKIVPYGLSNLPNCETIIIPTTLTDLGEYNVLCVLPNLKTIAVQGNEVIEGVIDLRKVTRFNSQLFEVSFNNTTPEIYLPANPSSFTMSKWAKDCKNLTFVVYPTSTTATYIRNVAEKQSSSSPNSNLPDKVTYKYYTVEQDPTLVRSGSQAVSGGLLSWSFDEATGTLTFVNDNPGDWNELLYNIKSTELASWKAIWKDAVVHIVIPYFSKLQFNGAVGIFANMPNLETVKFEQGSMEWQCYSGMFEGCTSLTTLGFGSSYKEGVIDLSAIYKFTGGDTHKNMFKGCTSISEVKFRATAPESSGAAYSTYITGGMFSGCTSLRSITIPSWMTQIHASAFAGCTSLKYVTLEGDLTIASASAFPDNADQSLVIYCPNEEMAAVIDAFGYSYTRGLYLGAFKDAITMDGYSVRIAEYNGLRSLYSFNHANEKSNNELGYSLVEYGAIMVASEIYGKYGCELVLENGEYVTPHPNVIKCPVFSNGDYVGKILASTTDTVTRFAATVTKFSDNYRTDIYFCGYEIWQYENGDIMIKYTDCPNDDYDRTTLYDISLSVYKNGLVNAENDLEGIVWSVIEENGIATLKAGTDYTYTEGQTDLNGNPITDTFVFKDIPAVRSSENSSNKTMSFAKSNVTITLVEDRSNYVAFYRGTGAIPAANAWNNPCSNQLTSLFMTGYTPEAVPNPKLTSSGASKIKTVILEHGITEIGGATFSKMNGMETLVYPSTLKRIDGSTFVNSKLFKAAYMTDVSAENYMPENNLLDFSRVDYVALGYFVTSNSAVEYIHLPANTSTDAKGMLNNCSNLKAIWFGDSQREDGVADFSESAVVMFGDYSFSNAKNLVTLKLPETVTTFYDVNEGTERHAFKNSAIKTIITENEVKAISDYVAAYGATYGLTYTLTAVQ